MLTADSPTDYGNVNGAGVVAVLKSGTNQFHGSAYGYVQDYRLDANSYGNGQTTPATPINPYSQAQFGGSVGGPICTTSCSSSATTLDRAITLADWVRQA